jgi:hypothetical protein
VCVVDGQGSSDQKTSPQKLSLACRDQWRGKREGRVVLRHKYRGLLWSDEECEHATGGTLRCRRSSGGSRLFASRAGTCKNALQWPWAEEAVQGKVCAVESQRVRPRPP